MLIIIGFAIALIALRLAASRLTSAGSTAQTIGWMSDQWVAEYRAAHP